MSIFRVYVFFKLENFLYYNFWATINNNFYTYDLQNPTIYFKKCDYVKIFLIKLKNSNIL